MASQPAPSPDPAKGNPANSALRDVHDRDDRGDDDIADPMQLFNQHYDDANGKLVGIATPAPGDKRPASPRKKSNATASSSPLKKKTN